VSVVAPVRVEGLRTGRIGRPIPYRTSLDAGATAAALGQELPSVAGLLDTLLAECEGLLTS
jgi:hypothetical protein